MPTWSSSEVLQVTQARAHSQFLDQQVWLRTWALKNVLKRIETEKVYKKITLDSFLNERASGDFQIIEESLPGLVASIEDLVQVLVDLGQMYQIRQVQKLSDVEIKFL